MQRSTGTIRSQTNAALTSQNTRNQRQQRTATSQRTGGAVSSSGHASSAHKIIEKIKPRVFDETNVDVTPKPMYDVDVGIKQARQGSGLYQSLEGTSTPTDILSNGSILNTNAILTGVQSFGAFPETSTHVSSESNQLPTDSMQETVIHEKEREFSALFYIKIEKAAQKKSKTDKVMASINMSETPTHTLLDIPSTSVSNEEESCELVKQNNQKYLELCKNKSGNDSYADRGMNTFNNPPKLKSTQTERITISEKGVWCTMWDMYDSFNGVSTSKEDAENDADDGDIKSGKNNNLSSTKSLENQSSTNQTSTVDVTKTLISEGSAITSNNHVVETDNQNQESKNYLENKNFQLNAFFMERLLNQNTYQPRQARYRGLGPLGVSQDEKDLSKSVAVVTQYDGVSLEKLWTYTSALSKDRNVSCMCWNKKNKDILAAGYGKFEFNEEQSGLVCCWSLKNPEFPERFFKTESGVTSLAFSQKHANLLAVGLFNGNILVYDVRNNNTPPLISTNESEHKHMSPVWHLKWTDRDRGSATNDEDEMEVLMSVSSDGRVTQWMIRKGFESLDYLKLKRVSTKAPSQVTVAVSGPKKDKNDGFISRHSGGLCFDIWSQDKSIYVCGTEEGFIHRCSTSYNEQYLDTYYGHSGPIYKLTWSPFLKNAFLSASGDWTLRLWKSNRSNPCLTFNSSSKAVYDVCWSNHSATLFCCVNESAIEIWDLSKSTLDPIYVTNPPGSTKLTSVSYSPNSDCLIVGTNDGSLFVYAIKNLPPPTKETDLEEIIKQSLISQLESIKIDEEEAQETLEQHQLKSMAKGEHDEEFQQERKDKLDAFEAKLDKIKAENAAKLKNKTKKDKKKENGKDSSDDDD